MRRLLISARDPGAASHLIPVAKAALEAADFRLSIWAALPADTLFRRAGLPATRFSDNGERLRERVRALLLRERPDLILTGFSGPDNGLDEYLLAAAGDTPTFTYQDYWGDLNRGLGRVADWQLVRDPLAASLTRHHHGLRTLVVGSPAHDAFVRLAPGRLRHGFRRRIGLAPTTKVVGWCDQPLWEYPGYGATLGRLLSALPPDCSVVFRPHPKETRRDRLRLRAILGAHPGSAGRHLDTGPLEAFLAGCDLVASAFSNCVLDLAHFNALPGHGGAVPMYLMFEPGLRRLYRTWTGLDFMPLAAQDLALLVDRRARLACDLRQALTTGQRRRFRTAARQRLALDTPASVRVLEALRAHAAGRSVRTLQTTIFR